MAWVPPKTWAVGDILTASDMNQYVAANMNFVNNTNRKTSTGLIIGASWSTSSTSSVPFGNATTSTVRLVSFAKRQAAVETNLHVTVQAQASMTTTNTVTFNLRVNGTDQLLFATHFDTTAVLEVVFCHTTLAGLAAGAYTLELYCLVGAGTLSTSSAARACMTVEEISLY